MAAAESAQQALAAVLAEAEGWGVGGRAPILLLSHDGVAEEAPLYLPSISPISPLYLPILLSHDGVAEEALLLRARARLRVRVSC